MNELRFIKKMTDSIDGWLTTKEGHFLYHAAKTCCKDKAIVEIGSWKGKSTVWLGRGAKAGNNARVYAIDPHSKTWLHNEKKEDSTYPLLIENLKKIGVDDIVTPIVAPSYEAVENWKYPIGMLFIDGSHHYEDVRRDFISWFPLVAEGGIIAIHDTTCCIRYCLSPYHFFIKKLKMAGWAGPKKVSEEKIIASGKFKNIGLIDTITFGTKCNSLSKKDKYINNLVKIKKFLPDALHNLIWSVFVAKDKLYNRGADN